MVLLVVDTQKLLINNKQYMTMRFSKAMAIGAFFLCAGHAHAASSYLFDNPENRAFLGVRVGLDISSAANGGGYYSNKAGFSAGAVYNMDEPLFRTGSVGFLQSVRNNIVGFLRGFRPGYQRWAACYGV
jgi:hypothetical protein